MSKRTCRTSIWLPKRSAICNACSRTARSISVPSTQTRRCLMPSLRADESASSIARSGSLPVEPDLPPERLVEAAEVIATCPRYVCGKALRARRGLRNWRPSLALSGEAALVVLAGDTKLRKSLLQMVGQHGLAEQVGRRAIVVQAR